MRNRTVGVVLGVLLSGMAVCASAAESYLGPTGLTGKTTAKAITVVKVDKATPGEGKVKPGDVIVGAGGKAFAVDARKEIAAAIDEAETEEAKGILSLQMKDGAAVDLQLTVLGRYSDTAPYDCPKSEAIIRRAADFLVEKVKADKKGKRNVASLKTDLLGLLATGETKYIDVVKEVIHASDWARPNPEDFAAVARGDKDMGLVTWSWGYTLILLSEYYLMTGDESVLPGIETYAVTLAKGQDPGGLWGHRLATPKRNHRLPGYAQMNQPSLSCYLGLALAEKCGVEDTDFQKGLAQSHAYFSSFIGRGAFNYGVHGPNTRTFNNNGTSASAAVAMHIRANTEGTRFFARMSATAHDRLESGHASYFFNVLWTPLGADLNGPEVTQRFFEKSRWLHTLYRHHDGHFTFNGGRAKGCDDTGAHLLMYALPRKALFITGKGADPSLWLSGEEATAAVSLGQTDYKSMTADALIALFGHPLPQVRRAAIWNLREREMDFVPRLTAMMKEGTPLEKQSALGFFGWKCPPELQEAAQPVMAAMLRDAEEDPEVRAAAAESLCHLGEAAYPYYGDMLKMVVEDEPDDPFRDIDWSLGRSLNTLCKEPFAAGLVTEKDLFYGAAIKLAQHKRQQVRAEGLRMLAGMPLEDFHRVADTVLHVIRDKDPTYHSYHSPGGPVGAGVTVLANLNIKEGMRMALGILDIQSGKGSFKYRAVMDSLAKYGANARPILEQMKQDERWKNVPENGKLKRNWNNMVKAIEQDEAPAELITLEEAMRAGNR